MRNLISRLVRVGIDSGEIGYLGPIFKDKKHKDHFEYIPLPSPIPGITSEKRTYGSILARNRGFGEHLADFMHRDRYPYRAEGKEMEPRKAADIVVHYDPEWDRNNTFGIGEWVHYMPQDFALQKTKQRYVFFFSGLFPYDKEVYREANRTYDNLQSSQLRHKELYLIGYFKVKEIIDFTSEKCFKDHPEFCKNAHFKERRARANPKIVKGHDYPDSKLLERAIQLNEWNGKEKKYCPNDIGKRLGIPPQRGVRALNLPLDDTDTRWLLRKIAEFDQE